MKTMKIALAILGAATFAFGETKYAKIDKVAPVTLPGKAIVVVTVVPGYHVQANPASAPNLIPTELTFETTKGIDIGKPVYPEGRPVKQQGAPDIAGYGGIFDIRVPLKTNGAKPGKYTVAGKLRYQACNDTTCFPPQKEPVTIEVQVN